MDGKFHGVGKPQQKKTSTQTGNTALLSSVSRQFSSVRGSAQPTSTLLAFSPTAPYVYITEPRRYVFIPVSLCAVRVRKKQKTKKTYKTRCHTCETFPRTSRMLAEAFSALRTSYRGRWKASMSMYVKSWALKTLFSRTSKYQHDISTSYVRRSVGVGGNTRYLLIHVNQRYNSHHRHQSRQHNTHTYTLRLNTPVRLLWYTARSRCTYNDGRQPRSTLRGK